MAEPGTVQDSHACHVSLLTDVTKTPADVHSALAQTDGRALVALARSFEVSPRQLHYLRARLTPRLDGGRGGGGGMALRGMARLVGRGHSAGATSLSGVQAAVLWLLGERSEARLSWRILKQLLMLTPPVDPPPPISAIGRVSAHYARLCSTCALTFCAVCLWGASGAATAPAALWTHGLRLLRRGR